MTVEFLTEHAWCWFMHHAPISWPPSDEEALHFERMLASATSDLEADGEVTMGWTRYWDFS